MSDRPAYRQVADELRRRIVGGVHQPGDLLPSESGLMDEFGISRTTARQAFAVLRGEGLVDAVVGRGVFVRQRPARQRRDSGAYRRRRDQAGETPAAYHALEESADMIGGRVPARAEVAERLGVAEGEEVLERRWPWAVSWIPSRLVERPAVAGTPEPEPGATLALLEEGGVRVTQVAEAVVVRAATPEEIETLRLRPGEPVFVVTRTIFADDDPVETADIVLAGDRYQLTYRFPVT
jgi:GntR family transcriptional regulator